MKNRIVSFQKQLDKSSLVLLSCNADIRYFAGFNFLVPEEREAFLIITAQSTSLIHNSFSPTPDYSWLKKYHHTSPAFLRKNLEKIIAKEAITTIYVDEESIFVSEYKALQQLENINLKPLNRNLIWQQRMIKDETEIKYINQAIEIAQKALDNSLPQLKPGITEKEFQKVLEKEMENLGSERPAFPTIIAFGPHSALPHHQGDDTQLEDNTAVLIDFGATVKGYRSDMTRTVWVGDQPGEEFLKIERIVKEAFSRTVDKLKSSKVDFSTNSLTAKDLDHTARQVITDAGYGPQFIHTTGHGVGLDIHEQPSLNWRNEQPILPGMTITIEPGIYLEGRFGYRHEDTIIVEN